MIMLVRSGGRRRRPPSSAIGQRRRRIQQKEQPAARLAPALHRRPHRRRPPRPNQNLKKKSPVAPRGAASRALDAPVGLSRRSGRSMMMLTSASARGGARAPSLPRTGISLKGIGDGAAGDLTIESCGQLPPHRPGRSSRSSSIAPPSLARARKGSEYRARNGERG